MNLVTSPLFLIFTERASFRRAVRRNFLISSIFLGCERGKGRGAAAAVGGGCGRRRQPGAAARHGAAAAAAVIHRLQAESSRLAAARGAEAGRHGSRGAALLHSRPLL